jgi:hypothetical protein
MDCRHFEMLVQRYHDGELNASCGPCRELDARFAAVFGALDDVPLAEPSAGFDAAVMSRVDVARYRSSALSRAAAAVRGGWDWLPRPLRITAGIAAVFGLFVAVYTPMIGMIASASRQLFSYIGSGLFIARRIIEDPSVISKYLATSTNYRLAGRILIETFEKLMSGVHIPHIVIAGLSALVVLVILVRVTRTVWSKGETHVSII